MAADLYPCKKVLGSSPDLTVHFDDDGYYWHLYPYFETAKLPGRHELIDLYGNAEIEGYELKRLFNVLELAENDLGWRADEWRVTTGWSGQKISEETEINRPVLKGELLRRIRRLRALTSYCLENGVPLCVDGD